MKKEDWLKKFETTKQIFNYIFYGVMVIVIIFLMIEIRKNNNPVNKRLMEKGSNNKIDSEMVLIKNANYKFKYELNINEKKYFYSGKRYLNKTELLVTGEKKTEYFLVDDIALEKTSTNYILGSVPFFYLNYLDNNLLEKIIKVAKYDDKTNKYVITNQMLESIINGNKIEDLRLNYLDLKINNKVITEITIDFTNFSKLIDKENKEVMITMHFYDFGTVQRLNPKR